MNQIDYGLDSHSCLVLMVYHLQLVYVYVRVPHMCRVIGACHVSECILQ